MKKRKLKTNAKIGIYAILILGAIGIAYTIDNFSNNNYLDKDYNYVSKTIMDESVPVVKSSQTLIKPYTAANIKIIKTYYDYKAEAKTQEQSIIKYNTTYMQNDGVDYQGDKNFEVISVLDGTVTSVKEDDLLGKIIEIKNTDNIVTIYSSLSEINVKANDTVKQGDVIGKSGENNIAVDLKDHLHFELLLKNNSENPELYYDKSTNEI